MKRKFSRILSVCAASALILAGCGSSEKSGKDYSYDLEGKYAPIRGFSPALALSNNIDDALNISEDDVENHEVAVMKFKNGNFEYINQQSMPNYITHYGKYTVKNGKIKFKYTDWKYDMNDDNSIVNINDDPNEFEKKRQATAIIEKMKKYNETGYFIGASAMPPACSNDKLSSYITLPLFIKQYWYSDNGVQLKTDENCDFLFVDTYGFELDGGYKYGKDFTIEFSPLSAYTDDKNSRAYKEGKIDEEYMDSSRIAHYTQFRVENTGDDSDFDTFIEFSDGEWEWYNNNGELLNNGKYQESKKYKGLIDMYITEDSYLYNEMALYDHMFYISEDGNIYFPVYFKID